MQHFYIFIEKNNFAIRGYGGTLRRVPSVMPEGSLGPDSKLTNTTQNLSISFTLSHQVTSSQTQNCVRSLMESQTHKLSINA